MREVALVKSILQTELLIYVAKCLMSFNVTKRTVNQSYSSISISISISVNLNHIIPTCANLALVLMHSFVIARQ